MRGSCLKNRILGNLQLLLYHSQVANTEMGAVFLDQHLSQRPCRQARPDLWQKPEERHRWEWSTQHPVHHIAAN